MIASQFGKELAEQLRGMQNTICDALGAADGADFLSDEWRREEGGGGVSRVLQDGELLEKAGVLFSAINGSAVPEVVLRDNPDLDPATPYFATGVSLIFHPRNPYVPAVHFNVRYFEVGPVYWFGGGMDLTPYYPERADCIHFHRTIKECCDRFDPAYYPDFKDQCDKYFYLKHRSEARGIGGIFFNYLKGAREPARAFILALGQALLDSYLPIVERRRATPYGERERAFQCHRRGRYVEFNLLYDQGTLFGLQSGGRTESILVSMPPVVNWHYNWRPEEGSPESRLADQFLAPQDWAGADA
ncbi:MAG: oxygen-dependent coproporphyrinogen oxidase [SAR324 cluster bacterium]|nr:oxygen-dependent coproporphyrinogen oxidase [SAR324 cluster bacterium]